ARAPRDRPRASRRDRARSRGRRADQAGPRRGRPSRGSPLSVPRSARRGGARTTPDVRWKFEGDGDGRNVRLARDRELVGRARRQGRGIRSARAARYDEAMRVPGRCWCAVLVGAAATLLPLAAQATTRDIWRVFDRAMHLPPGTERTRTFAE